MRISSKRFALPLAVGLAGLVFAPLGAQTYSATHDARTNVYNKYTRYGTQPSMFAGQGNLSYVRWSNLGRRSSSTRVASAAITVPILDYTLPGPLLTVHRVIRSWSETTITHSNAPPRLVAFSHAFSPTGKKDHVLRSEGITDLVQRWIMSGDNYGIAIGSGTSRWAKIGTREGGRPCRLMVTVKNFEIVGSMASGEVGKYFRHTLTARNDIGFTRWEYGSISQWFPGLYVTTNGRSLTISGWPTRVVASGFTIKAHDKYGSVQRVFHISINPKKTITGPTDVHGVAGLGMDTVVLRGSGGRAPYTWSVSPALPTGVTQKVTNSGTVLSISGTPAGANAWDGTVYFRDAHSYVFRKLRIHVANRLSWKTAALPRAKGGEPYPVSIQGADGAGPYRWSLVAGALPPGLRLAESSTDVPSVAFAGIPGGSGTYRFKIRVDYRFGGRSEREFHMQVTPGGNALVHQSKGQPLGGPIGVKTRLVVLSPSIRNDSTDSITVKQLDVLIAGPADNPKDLASVRIVHDLKGDNVVDPGDPVVGGPQGIALDNRVEKIALTGVPIRPGESARLLVVVDLRPDAPAGTQFAASMAESEWIRAVNDGDGQATTVKISEPLQGPVFFRDRRAGYAHDLDRDGAVDCVEVQRIALQQGLAAPGFTDPDGDGLLTDRDREIAWDHALQRPCLLQVPAAAARGSLLTVRGAHLGLGFPGTRVSLGGTALPLLFSGPREKVVRIPNRVGRGVLELEVTVGGRTLRSREITIH